MIDTEKDNRKLVERALLVGLSDHETTEHEAREHLAELADLVKNIDVPVVGEELVKLKQVNPRYLIGSGKAEEIAERVKLEKIDCLVFDCELSPSQQRNWERMTRICVIDRQEVILDIFAGRASTREAVLQVQLARMQYSLPRLTRAWTHLSRQRGGAKGTRGKGEQQIESDRRLVQQRISSLRRELEEVKKQRDTQRKSRDRHEMPHAAIVGYTNAGKSSLLNKISGADVLAEDKLFATLDPTTRRINLPNNIPMLLTDTVGFVRKLPHSLVEAFKSTLEEAVLADFLLLVLDISSPYLEEHWETTMSVLRELGADDKRIIVVFNKIDLQDDPLVYARVNSLFPHKIMVSTVSGKGIEELQTELIRYVDRQTSVMKLRIPPTRYDLIALAHEKGQVIESEYDDSGNMLMTLNICKTYNKRFSEFLLSA